MQRSVFYSLQWLLHRLTFVSATCLSHKTVGLVLTVFLLSPSHALVIKNPGNQNYRFLDNTLGPINTGPVNPIFIGKDYDLSGIAVSGLRAEGNHPAGAMMIAPHYYVTATHYTGATSYNFRNRDGVMITKATNGGKAMIFTYENGATSTSDLFIGKLAGSGITAADKISLYPVLMETTNNAAWYRGRQVFLYSMNGGNAFGINTITKIDNSGPAGLIGKSILYQYTGAYTNQAGLNGESGSPWGLIWNGQFCAGGAHSAYYGLISETPGYTSISSFIPYYADQIDAYMAEANPGEKLTRLEVFNDAPVVTGARDLVFPPSQLSETMNLVLTDDNLPLGRVLTLSVTSSNSTILPDSALVLSGSGANRSLVITPPPGGASGIVKVFLSTSDGEASASTSFNVRIIGTASAGSVSSSADDAAQSADGNVSLADPELVLGSDRLVGLRFPRLSVPPKAIITSASIQFTAAAVQVSSANLEISGQNYYNSLPFTVAPFDLSKRSETALSVRWKPASWNTTGERSAAQRTPDLSPLIQEMVLSPYWFYEQPIVLLIKGAGQRQVESQDKIGGQPAQLMVTFLLPEQDTVQTVTINSSANDAEQSAAGAVHLDSTDLELVNDGAAGNQVVGMRFENITASASAMLKSATIQFTAKETNANPVALVIRAEAVDQSAGFTAISNNLSVRPKTAASVSWAPSSWLTLGEQSGKQLTPDLTPLVREIFSRPGWVRGNALAFFITGSGTGHRTADSFEASAARPAKLQLIYQAAPTPYSYEAWSPSLLSDEDPDGDNIPNLMEYALGLNPAASDSLPFETECDPDYFYLTYTRPRITYGIAYHVEWSDDLSASSWSQTGTTTQVIEDNGTSQTIRTSIPRKKGVGKMAPARFVRLRVDQGLPQNGS